MRDSFIFYRSFFEATTAMSLKEKGLFFEALCEFALNKKEIDLVPSIKGYFSFVKPLIIANNKRYENGKLGGRPKTETKPTYNQLVNQNITEIKPKQNLEITKMKGNANDNMFNVNDNMLNANANENVHAKKESRGLPPSYRALAEEVVNNFKTNSEYTKQIVEQQNMARDLDYHRCGVMRRRRKKIVDLLYSGKDRHGSDYWNKDLRGNFQEVKNRAEIEIQAGNKDMLAFIKAYKKYCNSRAVKEGKIKSLINFLKEWRNFI